MAYNVPAYNTAKFSFGPGRLFLGAEGTTPTFEIGAVKGDATLSIRRNTLDVLAGSPQTLIQQYAVREEVALRLTGIEWNLNALAQALGAGTTTLVGVTETLEFGGSMTVTSRSLLYRHIMADGSTLDIEIYKVQGSGEIEISMKEADMHELAYEFNALEGTSNFANAALAAQKKLFTVRLVKA